MAERREALFRIIVAIVSGLILWVWMYVVGVFVGINFIIVLLTGKRNRDLAELTQVWLTQTYSTVNYISFMTNERPFPFAPLVKNMQVYRK